MLRAVLASTATPARRASAARSTARTASPLTAPPAPLARPEATATQPAVSRAAIAACTARSPSSPS
ncbi:MAG: hypothetical protein M5U28_16675 [Sandaracinaceae bacterium]|nr:hypothetical protein [Sandaracinaceae bacterium]